MGELYFLSSVVMYSKFSVHGILQARILEWIVPATFLNAFKKFGEPNSRDPNLLIGMVPDMI